MAGADDGVIYTYRWFATNIYGDGPYSDEVSVAVADQLLAPTNLVKVEAMST